MTLRLKPNAKPYLARPYPVPLPQRAQFKKELDWQEDIGVLHLLTPKEAEETEWAFSMFGIPKKNKKEMRTVGDFRNLNKVLEDHLYKFNANLIEILDGATSAIIQRRTMQEHH